MRAAVAGAVLLDDHDPIVGLFRGANTRQTNHYHGDTGSFQIPELGLCAVGGDAGRAPAQQRPDGCARPHMRQHLSIAESGGLRQIGAWDRLNAANPAWFGSEAPGFGVVR